MKSTGRRDMRRHRRKPEELPVTVRAAGNKVDGGIHLDATNLSEGGAFLRSSLLFEVGELLHLEIPLASGQIVKASGKVVRVSKSRSTVQEPGMGIEFATLSPEDRQTLAAHLPTAEPARAKKDKRKS